MKKIRLKENLFCILIFIFSNLLAQLPSARRTDWSNPGTNHPFNPSTVVNFINYNPDTTGLAPCDSILNIVINDLNGNGKIIFPSGKFLFKETIQLPDSIILEGASSGDTSLTKFILYPGENKHGISITGTTSNHIYKLNSSVTAGATKLYFPNPYSLSQGDFVWLKPYDDSLLVTSNWAYHSTGQLFKVLDLQNDSITIDKPIRRNYNGNNPPEIIKINPISEVHLKCISITRADATVNQTSNIYFEYAFNCSISGIESKNCNYAHIDIVNSKNISIEDSYIHHSWAYGSGGQGYGVMVEFGSSDCFIHQNYFNHLRHSMILQSGANGNVFAYNYSTDPYWTDPLLPVNTAGDIVLHGNYPYLNLFEGNVVQNIVIDNSHGKNGPYNTLFRNRAELLGIYMNNSPASDAQNFIGNQVTNPSGLYYLQGSNHFEYGNVVNGTFKPTSTSEPGDNTLFNYSFSDFYNKFSYIPPVNSNDYADNGPLIQPEKRVSIGKIYACGEINFPDPLENYIGEKISLLRIYPNPANNKISVHFDGNQSTDIVIMNVYGVVIIQLDKIRSGDYIDISGLKEGIYFLKPLKENQFGIKFIKY